jgi:hypothetical protein
MVILAMFDRLAIFGLVPASLRGQAQYRHAETPANRAMVVHRQLEWTGRHGPVRDDGSGD